MANVQSLFPSKKNCPASPDWVALSLSRSHTTGLLCVELHQVSCVWPSSTKYQPAKGPNTERGGNVEAISNGSLCHKWDAHARTTLCPAWGSSGWGAGGTCLNMVIVVSSVYLFYLVILFYLTVKVLSCIYNSYDSYLSYYELIMISDYEYNCIRNINVFVMARFIVSNGKKAI